MDKNVRDWTDEELVRDFMKDLGANAIYTPGVLEEICRRADMSDDFADAEGSDFVRIAQVAAQELCPDLCRA